MSESDLLIKIEGKKYAVWTSFYLRKNLEEIAHSFNFTVKAAPGSHKIKKHNKVEILMGGQACSAGRIDKSRHRLDKNGNLYHCTGRSFVRDLIDSATTVNWKNKYLVWIFQGLCSVFNVPFTQAEGALTSRVKEFVITGESPWNKMAAETDNQGLILTSGNSGGVILKKPGKVRLPITLQEGINITDLEELEDGSNEYSHYVVKAGDKEYPLSNPDISEEIHRPMVIYLDRDATKGELKERAETELRRGQSQTFSCTFKSWAWAQGQYWDTDFLVPVKAPSFDLDKYLVISQVEFFLKEKSKYVRLTLKDEAYYG